MGLVARFLEGEGIATVVLTPMPEFNREIGFPRTVALEFPYGRPIGQVNDAAGQRRVLLMTLDALKNLEKPGQVDHLPQKWHEDPKEAKWHPSMISPIVNQFLSEIKAQGKKARK